MQSTFSTWWSSGKLGGGSRLLRLKLKLMLCMPCMSGSLLQQVDSSRPSIHCSLCQAQPRFLIRWHCQLTILVRNMFICSVSCHACAQCISLCRALLVGSCSRSWNTQTVDARGLCLLFIHNWMNPLDISYTAVARSFHSQVLVSGSDQHWSLPLSFISRLCLAGHLPVRQG